MTPPLSQAVPLISARDLSYCTDKGRILFQHLNFVLPEGEILWVEGPAGSGKSTLLRLLGGTQVASSGEIDRQLEPEEIGFIPQLSQSQFLLPQTFLDILEVEAGDRDEALKLTSLGLLDENDFSLTWATASLALRQRLLLTAALLKEPKLLILDDPFPPLDPQSQDRISLALVEYVTGPPLRSIVVVSPEPLYDVASFGIPVRQLRRG